MKRDRFIWFCLGFLAMFLLADIGMIVKTYKQDYVNNQEAAAEKASESEFKYKGSAGSLETEKCDYSVALNYGDPNGGTDDQKIVDDDYSALYGTEPVIDDTGADTGEKIWVVLDHDHGTPAALPAIHDSDALYIKDEKGNEKTYVKVAQLTTGNRKTRDLLTDTGTNVLNKSFISQLGDPSNMIMFITCDGMGRLVTFWKVK